MKKENGSKYLLRVMTAPPPVSSCTHFGFFFQYHQLHTYLVDGPFLNRKSYKDIRMSYSLKYKHSKNKFIYKKINDSVE